MNYSQSDIEFMRKDALRRTKEMHSFANNGKNNVQAGKSTSASKEDVREYSEDNQALGEQKNSNPLNGMLSNLLSGGKLESDKFIIIILIVILAKEGVDLKLLIALGYIVM